MYHWRIHASVALAVAVATAVLAGALTVGDSVRGSLRSLALDGLGQIEYALVAPRLFHEGLTTEIESDSWFTRNAGKPAPVFLLRGSLEHRSLESDGNPDTSRAGGVSVIGCTEAFWRFGAGPPDQPRNVPPLDEPAVALTQVLADELGVTKDDVAKGVEVLLRVPLGVSLPAESLLGEKEDTVVSRRLRVAAVLRPEGLAQFSLSPSQHLPRNAFIPLDVLQEMLDVSRKVNAVLVAGSAGRSGQRDLPGRPPSAADELAALADSLRKHLRLEDYGLRVDRPSNANYVNITSDGLVLPKHVVDRATTQRLFRSQAESLSRPSENGLQHVGVQPVITYLANTITIGARKIPYSTITGVDSTAELGPLVEEEGEPILLADDEIVLNDWAADQLDAKIGDRVTVRFYEPESTHGQLHEHDPITLILKAIVPLATPDGQPTQAADPNLTPQLAGVTDQKSIGDWDVPFPLVETIRPEDETYWDNYSTTPKAFVSLALARQLWSSRFGVISSLRVGRQPDLSAAIVEQTLRSTLDPGQLGFRFQPIRAQALAASRGATSFDQLFLGFSMFLIAAAVLLIALLFRLGVQLRAGELGVLAATGIPGWKVRRLLIGEAAVIAVIGAIVGTLGGIGYAWLMLAALQTLWIEAVITPFLELHVSSWSLGFGWLLGVAAALVPCWLAIRATIRIAPRRLLSGDLSSGIGPPKRVAQWPVWTAAILITAAVGLGFYGVGKTGEAQAGMFFGAGALVLAAVLFILNTWLRGPKAAGPLIAEQLGSTGSRIRNRWTSPLLFLAARSASRNPGRSLLCIGLVAAASFLIVAISAFRLDTTGEGAGGFDLLAESDVPIQFDLATTDGRLELGFSDDADRQLADLAIYSLRVRAGDDASCLNMYRPRQPRILGVPHRLVERGGFAWADVVEKPETRDNPWMLLERPVGNDQNDRPIVPVVLDADTATYSLHLGGVGTQFTIDDPAAGSITLQIVGLLKKSLLQGTLLIGEEDFLKLFPRSSGYRFFLVDCPANVPAKGVETILQSTLGDYGFDATLTTGPTGRLTALYAVQNTYLLTFQSLGGLGLLLGTVGLAAVQLRSVVERRRELALMRAVGFRRRRLAWMVLSENGVLLVAGMAVGVFAAAVALLPHWLDARAGLPWTGVTGMLSAILVIGLVAGGLAAWKVVRTPLMPALRGE